MTLSLNVRHIELHPIRLEGVLEAADLGFDRLDDLIHPAGPLRYDFEAERQERGILLQGTIAMDFWCDCARCLGRYELRVRLEPWVCLLPWQGEEAVVLHGDCVDLTPYLRDDMVLALPQRPLCRPECGGLQGREPTSASAPASNSNAPGAWTGPASAWRELDRLNF